MQKFLLMMAFSLFLGSALKSQTVISGVVTDSLKAPIPFAAVFLSKTTIGTTTNANGAYTLTIPQPGEYEVAASCVGYKGFLKPFSADGKPHTLDIRLSVSSVQIEEVTVQAKSNHRIKNVTAMADLLLGQGQNAENSKILNEDQLFLTRDPQSGVVKGHSLRPLEVENRSLGYMLFYELTDFFFDPSMKLLRFSGNYYFKEMTGSPKEKKKWALHRLQTYYGSRMHFLRALFADSLKQQQYNLTNCEIENVVGKSGIVSQKGHSIVENRIRLDRSERQMILNSDKPLWIRYFDNKPELSQELIGFEPHLVESLLQLTARVTVYRDGRVDNPYAMTWSGEMAEERLSDLLPFDFMPPVTGHSEEGTLAERSAEAIFFDHLKEKGCRDQLFLHVDRNLYLPGDTLFFQAYVRDRKTGQFGSESRVLYLLLFDAKGEKADSARFRINNFTSSGYLTFPEHAVPGVYHLAAFTSAMQQEDPSAAFQMDLRVRESEELPQQVVCRFNKDLYHPSDTLELSVEVTDRAGNAITGQRVNCGLLFGKGRMKSDEANTNNRGESFFRWILPDTLHLQPQIKVFLKQSSGKFLSARELTVPWEVGFAGLAFLPEGGTFIEGIRQKVAFNATDLRGEPVPVTGLLKNSAGLILDTIRSGAYGPGSFVCLAKEGLTVELLSGGGQQRIWPLPQPTEKGFTLAVTKSDSVTLALDVEEGRYRGEQLTMAGFINGTPFFSREITLSRKVHLLLRTEQLPSGIAEFVLFDKEMNPLASRLFEINRHARCQIRIGSVKPQSLKDQETEWKISLADVEGKLMEGLFSISVTDSARGTDPSLYQPGMGHSFLFRPNFMDRLPVKALWKGLDNIPGDALDQLLLVYGYSRWLGHAGSKQEKPTMNFKRDVLEVKLAGLTSGRQSLPLLNLISLQDLSIRPVVADRSGYASVPIDSLTEATRSVSLMPGGKSRNPLPDLKFSIPFDRDYFLSSGLRTPQPVAPPDDMGQQENGYRTPFEEKTIEIKEVTVIAHPTAKKIFKDKYEEQYQYTDIKSLDQNMLESSTSLEMAIRKLVSPYKWTSENIYLRVPRSWLGGAIPALIVLDGMPIYNNGWSMVSSLSMSEVASLTILSGQRGYSQYGDGAQAGVIFITTRSASKFVEGQKPLPRPKGVAASIATPVQLFRQEVEYYVPTGKELEANPAVRGRATLYWNPEVYFNGKEPVLIRYPQINHAGSVHLTIHAVTADDNMGTAKYSYSVH